MGKDGKLYFAYNPNPSLSAVPLPGQLYSLNPNTGALSQVLVSGNPVPVNSGVNSNWGYFIQDQIDGESYNNIDYDLRTPDFSVNGKVQSSPTATPPVQTICNGSTPLNFSSYTSSFYNGYTIRVEKGTWSGTTFTYTSGLPDYNSTASPASVNVNLMTLFPGLVGYAGYIRVTLFQNSACGVTKFKAQVYQIALATADVNFSMIGPGSCTSPQARHTSLTFTPVGTVSSPPCVEGWLGASSLGFTNVTASSSSGYSGYQIVIDRVSPSTGAVISNVFNQTYTGTLPFYGSLTSYTSGYFNSNYDVIKNNYVFKLTITINTPSCGPISAYSYFKIIDGGPSSTGANWWRPTSIENVSDETTDKDLKLYPNPTTSSISLQWWSEQNATGTRLLMYNLQGQLVLERSIDAVKGANTLTLDVNKLPAGIYQYRLADGKESHSGLFEKQ